MTLQLPPYLNLQFLQQKLKVYSILPSLHLQIDIMSLDLTVEHLHLTTPEFRLFVLN